MRKRLPIATVVVAIAIMVMSMITCSLLQQTPDSAQSTSSPPSFEGLVVKDISLASSWELSVDKMGNGIVKARNRQREISVKEQIKDLEEVLYRNQAYHLNGVISSSWIATDASYLKVELQWSDRIQHIELTWPWPDTDDARKVLRIYAFVRTLVDDKGLDDLRPDIDRWLKDHPRRD